MEMNRVVTHYTILYDAILFSTILYDVHAVAISNVV